MLGVDHGVVAQFARDAAASRAGPSACPRQDQPAGGIGPRADAGGDGVAHAQRFGTRRADLGQDDDVARGDAAPGEFGDRRRGHDDHRQLARQDVAQVVPITLVTPSACSSLCEVPPKRDPRPAASTTTTGPDISPVRSPRAQVAPQPACCTCCSRQHVLAGARASGAST